MKRLILTALIALASVLGLTACEPSKTVLLFGDSLTVQSKTYAVAAAPAGYTVKPNAFGGTDPCDWRERAKASIAEEKPAVVVLAFVGNTNTCDGSSWDAAVASYRAAYADIAATAHKYGARVIIQPGPVRRAGPTVYHFQGDYRWYSALPGIASVIGAEYVSAAAQAVSPFGVYDPSTRDVDGLHLNTLGAQKYGKGLVSGVATPAASAAVRR